MIIPPLIQQHIAALRPVGVPDGFGLFHPLEEVIVPAIQRGRGVIDAPVLPFWDYALEGPENSIRGYTLAQQNRAKELRFNLILDSRQVLPRLLFLVGAFAPHRRRRYVDAQPAGRHSLDEAKHPRDQRRPLPKSPAIGRSADGHRRGWFGYIFRRLERSCNNQPVDDLFRRIARRQRAGIGAHRFRHRFADPLPSSKHHAGRHGKQRLDAVVHRPSLLPTNRAVLVNSLAQFLELPARQHGQRQDKRDAAGGAQIEARRPRHEQSAQVVLGAELAADIYAGPFGEFLEPLLQIRAHVAIGDPGRIAYDGVRPAPARREGQRTRQVAGDIGPDGVSPFLPEPVEGRVSLAEVADRELLLARYVRFVVLLRDADQRRFDLLPRHADQRARPHPLDRLVEQAGIATERLGKFQHFAAVRVGPRA